MFQLQAGPEPLADVLAPLLGSTLAGTAAGFEKARGKRKTEEAFQKLRGAESLVDQLRYASQLQLPEKEKLAVMEHLQSSRKEKEKAAQNELLDQDLAQMGMPQHLRKAFIKLGPGAQTRLMQHWLEHGERESVDIFQEKDITEIGEKGKTNQEDFGDVLDIEKNDVLKEIPPTETEIEDVEIFNPETESQVKYKFPKLPSEKGLTSKEKIARENIREKTNASTLADERKKRRNFEGIGLRLERLNSLNKSFELPENPLFRFFAGTNVGLRLLQTFGNPSVQSFIKTIKDFTVAAKDSFGARVTNFELNAFLQRLPQLINSPEGRNIIIKQMQLVNEADLLESESVIKTIENYGAKNISPDQISKIADSYSSNRKKDLRKEMAALDDKASKEWKELKKFRKKHPKEIVLQKDGIKKRFRSEGVPELIESGWEIIE